jgi:tetratricopeptide (TPR) repeat protein
MFPLVLLPVFLLQQDIVADALKALDEGQPAVAEPLLRKAVEADPADYRLHFELGLSLSMQNKDADAIPEFRKTLEEKPGLYEADLNLGMVLLRDKNAADALPILKEAAETKPDQARANFYYGQALLQTGDTEHAGSFLRTAASLDPKYKEYLPVAPAPPPVVVKAPAPLSDFDTHMNLGKQLSEKHQYPAAAQQFFEATKLQPHSLEAWNNLAAVLVIDKRFAEGIGALDRIKALGQETPGQLYFRAISLDALKQHKPAIAAYRGFLASDGGKMPDEEFLARQRIRIIESEMKR